MNLRREFLPAERVIDINDSIYKGIFVIYISYDPYTT